MQIIRDTTPKTSAQKCRAWFGHFLFLVVLAGILLACWHVYHGTR